MLFFNLVSSAKLDVIECFMQEFRSFRYKIKKTGPRTVPCGTPDMTFAGVEDFPLMTTVWYLFERYDLIHFSRFPPMP